jgi:hypothetical protein
MGAEMRRLHGDWGLAVAAGLLMLLSPLGAAAVLVPGMDTQNFILGMNPYLKDAVDLTGVNPGVNAPDVPTAQLHTPFTWIKLDGGDYDVDNGLGGNELIPIQPPNIILRNATTDDPVSLNSSFNITWNGTIHGADVANGDFAEEYCSEFPGTEDHCLMTTSEGELKLMFVIWDVRWTDADDIGDVTAFLDSPSILGGFDKDGFMAMDAADPILAGPLHVDDSVAGFLTDVPGKLEIDNGLGIKFAVDSGESFWFTADWLLGQNPADLGAPLDLFGFNFGYSLFAYYVPEPGSVLLMLSGLIGLAALGGRRRA